MYVGKITHYMTRWFKTEQNTLSICMVSSRFVVFFTLKFLRTIEFNRELCLRVSVQRTLFISCKEYSTFLYIHPEVYTQHSIKWWALSLVTGQNTRFNCCNKCSTFSYFHFEVYTHHSIKSWTLSHVTEPNTRSFCCKQCSTSLKCSHILELNHEPSFHEFQ